MTITTGRTDHELMNREKQGRRVQRTILYHLILVASASTHMGYTISTSHAITVLPPFLQQYGIAHGATSIIPSLWLSLWNFLGPLGGMLGALTGAQLQDRSSRRFTLAMAGVVAMVATGVLFSSDRYAALDARRTTFLVGGMLQDFSNGMLTTQAQTYISEVASDGLKRPALTLPGVFTALGHLIARIFPLAKANLQDPMAYRVPIALEWIFTVQILVIAWIVPESPVHLVRKSDFSAAINALRRQSRTPEDVETILRDLTFHVEDESVQRGRESWLQCFNKQNRNTTSLIAFCSCLPAAVGVPLWATKSYFLKTLGLFAQQSLTINVIGVILSLAGHILAYWLLYKVRRQNLLFASLCSASLLYAAISLCGIWPGIDAAWAVGALMLVIIFSSAATVLPTSTAIVASLSSLQLRSKSQGISGVFAHLANVVVAAILPHMYGVDAGDLGAKIALLFVGLTCLAAVVVYMVGPSLDRSVSWQDPPSNEADKTSTPI